MTELDSSARFDGRFESYLRYRPRYPQKIITFLQKQIGLTGSWRVADVGSGTDFLAERFVELGCEVTGVEPNSTMREAGDKYLYLGPISRASALIFLCASAVRPATRVVRQKAVGPNRTAPEGRIASFPVRDETLLGSTEMKTERMAVAESPCIPV